MQRDAERQRDDEGRTGQEEEEDDDEEEEEEECSVSVEAELASMEEKWREQCTVNENLKLLLANEKKQFQVCKHTHTHTQGHMHDSGSFNPTEKSQPQILTLICVRCPCTREKLPRVDCFILGLFH